MPPRFVYWTIIFGGQPTSFRSATRDELLPTFKQIQSKHPDAQLRYFARGKLWYSEEEERAALTRERLERRPRRDDRPFRDRPFRGDRPPQGDRPPRPDRPRDDARKVGSGGWKPRPDDRKPDAGSRKPDAGSGERPWAPKRQSGEGGRGRDWRPGGEHKDPRARFKVPRDVKRAGMAKKFGWKKKKDEK